MIVPEELLEQILDQPLPLEEGLEMYTQLAGVVYPGRVPLLEGVRVAGDVDVGLLLQDVR